MDLSFDGQDLRFPDDITVLFLWKCQNHGKYHCFAREHISNMFAQVQHPFMIFLFEDVRDDENHHCFNIFMSINS